MVNYLDGHNMLFVGLFKQLRMFVICPMIHSVESVNWDLQSIHLEIHYVDIV
jgi:hypothetical protein